MLARRPYFRHGVAMGMTIAKIKIAGLALCLLVFAASNGTAAERRFITLASTTSTVASGLYDAILPIFTAQSGIAVHVIAVGTGQALRLARNGDADALLVHHPPSERKFIAEGYGIDRRAVMYNQFLIVGPQDDPAGAAGGPGAPGAPGANDAATALRRIAARQAAFVSRADNSGTHMMELGLWRTAKVDPTPGSGAWYKESGSGMGATLRMASAMQAYALTDRGTWLSYRDKAGLIAIFDRPDLSLRNQYSVMLVNPAKHPHVKAALARRFMDWLTSPTGQTAIAGVTMAGEKLFIPNAQ